MGEDAKENACEDTITGGDLRFVRLWAVGILLLFAFGGYSGVRLLRVYKVEAERIRQSRIKTVITAPDASSSDLRRMHHSTLKRVSVGIYVSRIGALSLNDAVWAADFDIWFRWTGDNIRPGETFQLANGDIDLRERRDAYTKGREHYERYRVKAHLAKRFDSSRFPFSDEGLHIEIRDSIHSTETLRYVADVRNCGFNSSGVPSSLRITKWIVGVMENVDGSSLGDPRVTTGDSRAHPGVAFAVLVRPLGARLFLSLFQALFAAVAIALLAAFIKPVYGDGRFGLGVGAFFAAVSNNISVVSVIPVSDRITLAAMVNAAGLVTIALTLIQSTVSLHYFDSGRAQLSLLFDKVSFVVLLLGYTVFSLLLPLAAM